MGEIAALLTAVCWAGSSIFFTATSKALGAVHVNRIRLVFAVGLIMLVHALMLGQPLPLQAEPERWLWLGLSGVAGLVLGDTFLFKAYAMIGNRLGTLVMACVPVISSLGAWLLLGEAPALASTAGMALCLGGIAVVVLERPEETPGQARPKKQFILGVLYALGGAVGQAAGLVLAKKGLSGDFPAISGVMIRMLVAMIFIWGLTLATGQFKLTLVRAFQSRQALGRIAVGTVVGPFLGVWLSQTAVQRAYVGVASTLMALTPIFLLPVAKWVYKENVSLRAALGTVVALAGVALIFVRFS